MNEDRQLALGIMMALVAVVISGYIVVISNHAPEAFLLAGFIIIFTPVLTYYYCAWLMKQEKIQRDEDIEKSIRANRIIKYDSEGNPVRNLDSLPGTGGSYRENMF